MATLTSGAARSGGLCFRSTTYTQTEEPAIANGLAILTGSLCYHSSIGKFAMVTLIEKVDPASIGTPLRRFTSFLGRWTCKAMDDGREDPP